MLLRTVAVRHDGIQPVTVRGGHFNDNPGAHAPDSHAIIPAGIPRRASVTFYPLAEARRFTPKWESENLLSETQPWRPFLGAQ
jgi:hypothetical protein